MGLFSQLQSDETQPAEKAPEEVRGSDAGAPAAPRWPAPCGDCGGLLFWQPDFGKPKLFCLDCQPPPSRRLCASFWGVVCDGRLWETLDAQTLAVVQRVPKFGESEGKGAAINMGPVNQAYTTLADLERGFAIARDWANKDFSIHGRRGACDGGKSWQAGIEQHAREIFHG